MNLSGSLIVGYDFSNKDTGVLIVGKYLNNDKYEIINAFESDEAMALFKKLIEKEKMK